METITGYLIRYHRLKQNLSQEGLCKGICVVSYLSKIEQGKAEADASIIHALFHQLGMEYYDDPLFVKEQQEYLRTYFERYVMEDEVESFAARIKEQHSKLLCSPLFLTYLLFVLYENRRIAEDVKRRLEELSVFISCMNDAQLYLYDLAYAFHPDRTMQIKYLHKADKILQCSVTWMYLGNAYAGNGQYSEALQSHQKALALANEEGMFHISAHLMLSIGNHYANMGVEQLMLLYYKKAMTAARSVHQEALLRQVYYNLGATYEEWGQHEQAIFYLEKALPTPSFQQNFMIYHKLVFAFYHMGKKDQAKEAFINMKSCYRTDFKEGALLLCEFIELYVQENHLDVPRYQSVLEDICFHEHPFIFHGIVLYHLQYLIEVYVHQRRYKEVLKLVNMQRDRGFSFE